LPARMESQRGAVPLPFDYELEVDTGMSRHGVSVDQALAWVGAATGDRSQSALALAGVFTHFCAVDATGRDSMRGQWDSLSAVHRRLLRAGHRLRHHACNTLGLSVFPEACADMVRIGGGIYGLGASSGLDAEPVLTLKTRVVRVRDVQADTPVGYGSAWRSKVPTRLLLLPCGYADGLSKALWQDGEVLVRGRRRRIAGILSMNQTVVDAGPGGDVQVGDEVVLLGGQGKDRVFAEDRVVAGGSAYEVTTALRLEMPRRYRNGGSGPAVGERPHDR
jgi:alanine racemase